MIKRRVVPGISTFLQRTEPVLRNARMGVVVHPASVLPDLTPTPDALRAAGFNVAALFGPQHGVWGEKQDDMIESDSFTDPETHIPVYSLYGDVRQPTSDMLADLDVLVFDLQDVGVRVYTFVWTMTLAMEACGRAGVRVVVLDRPNPIGGRREGPIREEAFRSFVGLHPVPLRHGLTAGEIARLAVARFGIDCDLEVVPCEGWRRDQWFDETGLPFVLPSPNIPTLDSCTVFPGMVLLEGTNLSEGRGTTRPFELVGAPYLDARPFARALSRLELPGVVFRPCSFEPTFQKHAGTLCGGVQVHVTDREQYRPVETTVHLIQTARACAPSGFAWRDPPYEYERVHMPIDVLWGNQDLRHAIDAGATAQDIMAATVEPLRGFDAAAAEITLYD